MKKKGLMVLFFFLTFFCFTKDMFRVHETQLVEMQDEQQSLKARLAINDMLVIKLPKTRYFLQGLSLEIKIPKAVADYRDAVAFYVYKNISNSDEKNYRLLGRSSFFEHLPRTIEL